MLLPVMFLAIFVFFIDVLAVNNVGQSRQSARAKAAWIIAIVVLPIVGAVAWVLIGPRQQRRSTSW